MISSHRNLSNLFISCVNNLKGKITMEKIIGIYQIKNLINNKVYIGQSWNIYTRWNAHKTVTTSVHLSNAIKKYGLDNFEFTILKEFGNYPTLTQIFLDAYEDKFIVDLDSMNPLKGYNLKRGGAGGLYEENAKFNISKSKIGHSVSSETREKIRKTLTGRKFGKRKPGTGENISKGVTGKRLGCIWINNELENKTIMKDQLPDFIKDGYKLGRIRRDEHYSYVYNEKEVKRVNKREIENYLLQGWKRGDGTAIKYIDINNGINIFHVKETELNVYLSKGYKLGSLSRKEVQNTDEYKNKMSIANKGRKYIHKDNVVKFVKPEEYDKYIIQGWLPGHKNVV